MLEINVGTVRLFLGDGLGREGRPGFGFGVATEPGYWILDSGFLGF